MKHTDPPVIIKEYFEHPKEIVWNALTEKDQMVQWFFENIPDFKPEVGFSTAFNVQGETNVFPHIWKITAVTDYQEITFDWRYEGFDGISKVTFQLHEEKGQTTLTVINEVIADFDDSIPEFKRSSCELGWQYFIQERLIIYLN